MNLTINDPKHAPWWRRLTSFFRGGQLTSPDKGSQIGPISSSEMAGDLAISDDRALQISTVFACVRIVSTVTASLPLDVFIKDGTGRRKVRKDESSLARLLQYRPNTYMTATEFREAMTMQLCFYGNAYAYIDRNSNGDVVSLMPLLSVNMDVILSEDKKIIYRYKKDREYADYSHEEIFHLKGFGYNGIVGLSPIAFAAKTAGVAVAMEDQQRDFYVNGAKSPKILSTNGAVLSKEQRAQIEENFKEIANGPVNKRLWILEAAFSTYDIGVSPQDAETMAARKFQVSEIARFFGVPPHLVGDVEKSTSWGSGIEQQNIGFLQYTLAPYLTRWEDAIERWLIKPADVGKIHAEHNLDGLLRGDSTSRANYMATMRREGLRTINELRRLDNMPPVEGGDSIFMQSQNIPLSSLGKENDNNS